MRLLPLLLLVCVLGAATGLNFNIFRWPSFNRHRSGKGGGHAGHTGHRKANPLRGLHRLKAKAITGLRNLKAPIFQGIRSLKSHVRDLKGSLFSKGGDLFSKGKGGGQSSYVRQPPSHYGHTGGHGGGGGGYSTGHSGHGGGGGGYSTGHSGHGGGGGGYSTGHGGGGFSTGHSGGGIGGGHTGGHGGGHSSGHGGGGFTGGHTGSAGGYSGGHSSHGSGQAGSGHSSHGSSHSGSGHSSHGSSHAAGSGHSSHGSGHSSHGSGHSSHGSGHTGSGHSSSSSNGYLEVSPSSPTSTGLGTPSAPSSSYGSPPSGASSPSAPSTGHRAPPSGGYSSPRAPSASTHSSNSGTSAASPSAGYRAHQTPSGGGFVPSAPITGHASPSGTGLRASKADGIKPLRNTFPTGAASSSGSSYRSQEEAHINAPLSAAMTMSHLLDEDEVVKDAGKWRPVTASNGVRAPDKTQDASFEVKGPSEEPLFINLDDSLDDAGLDDPVEPADGDSYIVLATEEKDEVLLVDKGSADAAAEALAKVAEAALLIGEEPQGRSLTGGRPQENVISVGQDAEGVADGGATEALRSGQESNMMFAGLMEELELTSLTSLIRRANLEAMLTTEGGFTIFAPSDSAFLLLPRSAVSKLQNSTDKLREVVLFHVVPGVFQLEDLANDDLLSAASPKGRKLRVNVYQQGSDDKVVTVNGARIKRHDMLATNGVIHVIDRVLYPMADLSLVDHLTNCNTFTGANVAVTGAGLTPVLEQEGPFTVFLPTTEAFAAIDNATVSSFIENITLLQHVLMYHIVPGAYFSEGLRDGMWLPTLAKEQELQVRVTTDGYSRRLVGVGHTTTVIKHDIIATNGVIHVIDSVMRPEKETPICGHF